jgi:hypothetical protein
MNAILLSIVVVGMIAYGVFFSACLCEPDRAKSIRLMLTAIGMLICVCVAGMTGSVLQSTGFDRKCRAAGGVPHFNGKGPDLCLRPDSVVELDRRP